MSDSAAKATLTLVLLGGCHLAAPYESRGREAASDAAPGVGPCTRLADADDTVLLFTFDESTDSVVGDATGRHPGQLIGSAAIAPGRQGCGSALTIPAAPENGGYFEIPHDQAFDLPQGSLDLLVRFDTPPEAQEVQGVIGRDALWVDQPGHLAIFRGCDGWLIARLQQDEQTEATRCVEPTHIRQHEWHHIGVNFGGPEGFDLYVDGMHVPAKPQTQIRFSSSYGPTACTNAEVCGGELTTGIAGNRNPWVIGAFTSRSHEGSATPVSWHLGGMVDHVRLSRTRRDYGRR